MSFDVWSLRARAFRILGGEEEIPSGGDIQAVQIRAIEVGDDNLLALWSRIRWRWAVANRLTSFNPTLFPLRST